MKQNHKQFQPALDVDHAALGRLRGGGGEGVKHQVDPEFRAAFDLVDEVRGTAEPGGHGGGGFCGFG